MSACRPLGFIKNFFWIKNIRGCKNISQRESWHARQKDTRVRRLINVDEPSPQASKRHWEEQVISLARSERWNYTCFSVPVSVVWAKNLSKKYLKWLPTNLENGLALQGTHFLKFQRIRVTLKQILREAPYRRGKTWMRRLPVPLGRRTRISWKSTQLPKYNHPFNCSAFYLWKCCVMH